MIVLIVISLLVIIFLQDILTRSIWWFLPPLLFGALVLFGCETFSLKETGFNLLFVVALMIFLTLYIRVRFGKLENPFKEYFGLGDFLFILALTPLLPFREFVFFFTIGTFLVLIIHLVVHLIRKQQTIPYAGYFSLVTIAHLVLLMCNTNIFQAFLP